MERVNTISVRFIKSIDNSKHSFKLYKIFREVFIRVCTSSQVFAHSVVINQWGYVSVCSTFLPYLYQRSWSQKIKCMCFFREIFGTITSTRTQEQPVTVGAFCRICSFCSDCDLIPLELRFKSNGVWIKIRTMSWWSVFI